MQLYPYQAAPMPALEKLMDDGERFVLLAASTGYGKTVMACHLMSRLPEGVRFGVLAPRATLSAWRRTADAFGLKPEFILNPEAIRTGSRKDIIRKDSKVRWKWTGLGKDDWLVLDEYHRFGGMESQNAYMAAYAKPCGIKVLGMTATLADSPLKLRLTMYLMNQLRWVDFYRWAQSNGCYRDPEIHGHPWKFVHGKRASGIMSKLNAEIFPAHGVRLRSEDIPGFPEVQNIVDPVTPSATALKAVKAAYDDMPECLKNPDSVSNPAVRLLRWRQRIEEEKLPVFKELVEEAIEAGMSVVASFNFTAPLFEFAEEMKKYAPAMIYGSDEFGRLQSAVSRDAEIKRFQTNETPLCLLTITAGGVGLSLGDELGGHPRIAFHNLPLDSTSLVQLLGRIHRANSKTKSINRIVLLDGVPVEDLVFRILNNKINNLSALQNDDLDLAELVRKPQEEP